MKKLVALLIASLAFVTAPAFADFWDGYQAYKKGDYKTALREFQPFAEQGDSSAQFYLGLLYDTGWGVPQDYKEAVKWYRLSAEQGYADAQYNLGLMYNDGRGVPQDYKQTVKWYRLSAEQGDATAQNNLGFMYGHGHGVLQDLVRSHMWFNLAASNGDETSAKNRDGIAIDMTSAQIEKAQNLARACVAKDYKGC